MKVHDNKIFPGQGVRVRGVFRDPANGAKVDPTTVELIFKDPDGETESVSVDRIDQGRYSGMIVVDKPGKWYWRMSSDNPAQAAKEESFLVEKSKF